MQTTHQHENVPELIHLAPDVTVSHPDTDADTVVSESDFVVDADRRNATPNHLKLMPTLASDRDSTDDPMNFICEYCNKSRCWTVLGSKHPHIVSHHKSVSPRSYIDNFVEIEKYLLNRHPDRDNRATSGVVLCTECPQTRDSWTQMVKHYVRRHNDNREYLVSVIKALQMGKEIPRSQEVSWDAPTEEETSHVERLRELLRHEKRLRAVLEEENVDLRRKIKTISEAISK